MNGRSLEPPSAATIAVGVALLAALSGCRTVEKPGPVTRPSAQVPDTSPDDESTFLRSLPELSMKQYRALRDRLPTDRSKVLMCCHGCVGNCRDPEQACRQDTSCIEMGRRTGNIKRHCLGMVPAFEPMSAGDCADLIRKLM